jgi:hypothetical protein
MISRSRRPCSVWIVPYSAVWAFWLNSLPRQVRHRYLQHHRGPQAGPAHQRACGRDAAGAAAHPGQPSGPGVAGRDEVLGAVDEIGDRAFLVRAAPGLVPGPAVVAAAAQARDGVDPAPLIPGQHLR